MTKQYEKIIKNQDFGQWVNIDLYKNTIMAKCKGKLDISEISTLSNMFAIIFAMKARDYVNYISDKEPIAIEKDAERCANNLLAYLQNYPAIRRDWLELFVIGYAGESISLQGKEQEYHISVDEVSGDVEDDEYAIHAALFVSSLDDRLSQEQQNQITKAVIERTSKRKDLVKSRLAKRKGRDTLKNKWKKFVESLKGRLSLRRNLKTLQMIPVTPVIRGGVTAAGMIVAAKMFPAYGFATLISGGVIGYMASNGLMNSFRKMSNVIFYGRSRVERAMKSTKKMMGSKKQAAKIEQKVDAELDAQIFDLKAQIDEEVKRQKEILSSLEKDDQGKRDEKAPPKLSRAENLAARRNGGVLPPGKRASKGALGKMIDDRDIIDGMDDSITGDVNAASKRNAAAPNQQNSDMGIDGLDVLSDVLKKAGASAMKAVSPKSNVSSDRKASPETTETINEIDQNSGGTIRKEVVKKQSVSM